jgi:hypothetical protein
MKIYLTLSEKKGTVEEDFNGCIDNGEPEGKINFHSHVLTKNDNDVNGNWPCLL